MQPAYSRPFRWLMQIFFALWGTAGMAGLVAVYAHSKTWQDELQRNCGFIIAILCGCIVTSAIAGLVHMRRKESRWFSEGTEALLESRTPANNVFIGLGTLAMGAAITLYTYDHAAKSGGVYFIMYGAMIFGAIQALYGAGQCGWRRKRRPGNT